MSVQPRIQQASITAGFIPRTTRCEEASHIRGGSISNTIRPTPLTL